MYGKYGCRKYYEQAENLLLPDYIDLIERLVHRLRDKGDNTLPIQLDWQELYGLGKGLWDDEDTPRSMSIDSDEEALYFKTGLTWVSLQWTAEISRDTGSRHVSQVEGDVPGATGPKTCQV